MKCLYVLTLIGLLYGLYALKCYLDIDLGVKGHTPQIIQDKSFGIIRCKWFPNNHHCD